MAITNRDVYRRVREFEAQFDPAGLPTLEEYLRSLWWLVSQAGREQPTIGQFLGWIEAAFTQEPPPYDPAWVQRQPGRKAEQPEATYEDWEDAILYQIVDLRQMAEAGILDNEYRYFGVDAPRGARWYNFDPLTYLECGVRGTLGGYTEDEVMVLIPPAEGESADSPVFPIRGFTWKAFIDILMCGQFYE
ncbi:MAG: uroporphyrinogen decarboxylase family protein [Chloroflexi bacterium]|nr:uroporphyrinogen decarboxylase family protein [Chloroflexota bacterium]MCI0578939.1 uroporphyrinogen decarboxylase family protein [Chloroflexota bacterium]MCI0646876.1 uroporphyrinogen decarboxylase family protein [Chloroflexota bacterium]MCI0730806.1 uroporphyrinogen decarboxylase family protein [Chloroflexota bacterium]